MAQDGILMKQPWITPSLFDGKPDWVVDEWTYAEFTKDNRSELERHWDTWITEQDLRAIAGAGLNTVRIPVGCEFILPPAAYSMLAWSLARSTFLESRGSGAGEDLPVMGGWLVTRTSLVRHVQHGRLWVVPGVTDRDCLSLKPRLPQSLPERSRSADDGFTPNLTASSHATPPPSAMHLRATIMNPTDARLVPHSARG